MEQFDSTALMRLMNSPEGKKLLQLMRQDGGKSLSKAAAAASAGNYAQAQTILAPLLNGTEAKELAEKLEAKLG